MKIKTELQYIQKQLEEYDNLLVRLEAVSWELIDKTEAFPIYFNGIENIEELQYMVENAQENLRELLGAVQE